MQLFYTPSENAQKKAKYIWDEHEKGRSYPDIGREIHLHKNQLMRLAHWHRDNVVNVNKEDAK